MTGGAATLTAFPPAQSQAPVAPTAPEALAPLAAATRGYTHAVPTAGPQGPPLPSAHRLPPARRARPGNRMLLAASGAAAIAGLAIWLAASSGAPASSPSRHSATQPATARPAAPARTVDVNQAALAGQPVASVVRELRQLGLQPQVTWVTTAQQPPGTVISVQPAGHLPAGSTVTVTAAQRPSASPAQPGQGPPPPGNGNGKGHGKGKGGG